MVFLVSHQGFNSRDQQIKTTFVISLSFTLAQLLYTICICGNYKGITVDFSFTMENPKINTI